MLCSQGSAKLAYYSFIQSHLTYGIAFWGYCTRELFNSTFVLQKRAIRYICRAGSREHCRPLFNNLRILTLPCLFILESVSLIHKKYRGMVPEGNYNTRQGNNLSLPIPKSSLTKNSIIYESRKIYNNLPLGLRNVASLKAFRRKVKDFLVHRAYYDLQEFYNDSFT